MSERGVTLVEYALVIGTVVVGSMSSVGALNSSVGDHYASTADDIGQSDLSAFDVTTTTAELEGDSTTTSTLAAMDSTTTTASAEASPTTTSDPDDHDDEDDGESSSDEDGDSEESDDGEVYFNIASSECSNESYKWEGSDHAKVRLEFDDEDGDDLEDAEVEVEFTLKDGTTGRATGTTNSWGRVAFEWDWLDEDDFEIEVRVIRIEKDDDEYDHDDESCEIDHDD